MASSSSANGYDLNTALLPVHEIPGSTGHRFIGPIKDRYDFFYVQGRDKFFKSRMEKYHSTVFRTNMPPGPFISFNSEVVVLLDAISFPILFDTEKVEKRDVFTGTYMPSVNYYGGFRVLAYLDPSESKHHTIKNYFQSLCASFHKTFVPDFVSGLSDLFTKLELELSQQKSAKFNPHSEKMSFDFVFKLFNHRYPSETPFGSDGTKVVAAWLLPQLAPVGSVGLNFVPSFVEDFLAHTFRIPFCLVKPQYRKLYKAFYTLATEALDFAEKQGIPRDEACHNLVFTASFNSYGGMQILFPTLLKWVASAGKDLHRRLAEEIRTIIKENNGGVTVLALEEMPLTKSVVYETLRIEPPVPYQYAKAKEDIVISSHDASFKIKKGEMLFGYQPFATKDGRVFENPDKFIAERFMGEGEKLKKYVYWSNGRETDAPTADNKQCPGKDLVILWCRVFLVEFFLRYDTVTVESGENIGLGSPVKITSLTKATTK